MHRINRALSSQKITIIGAAANLFLAVLKIATGIIGSSQALIADGIHSLSDLLSDALVWYAAKHSGNEPDEEHPYGHGRFETAATLSVGILLILAAAGIIYDAGLRFIHPENLMVPGWLPLGAALVSILANEALYQLTVNIARKINSPMLRANAWHHRTDAISSIVVLIGIGGSIAGMSYFDAIAAIIVGLMIARIGWKFTHEALEELVDTGLDPRRLKILNRAVKQVEGVTDIHMLRTRRLGHKICADLHVQVSPFISVSEGHMISVEVEKAARKAVHNLHDITVHIDPEDDDNQSSYVRFPGRKEVETIIKQSLDKPVAEQIKDINLHYLNNRVYIDLYLALDAVTGQALRQVQQDITAKLESHKIFSGIRVFYFA